MCVYYVLILCQNHYHQFVEALLNEVYVFEAVKTYQF